MKVPTGKERTHVNVLWDGGATLSMITFKKATEMKLKGDSVRMTITKVGGTKEDINSFKYEVPLIDQNGNEITLQAYGIQRISTPLEKVELKDIASWFSINENEIERPFGDVDMLIGFEYAGYHPVREQSVNHLLLLKNIFGKCIGG